MTKTLERINTVKSHAGEIVGVYLASAPMRLPLDWLRGLIHTRNVDIVVDQVSPLPAQRFTTMHRGRLHFALKYAASGMTGLDDHTTHVVELHPLTVLVRAASRAVQ